MASHIGRINQSSIIPLISGLLMLSLTACATQRYGRMTPVSPGERTQLNCEQIALEIEKAEFFLTDIRRQRSQTTGAHVLGALGDFGIGNVMEGDAAEKSGMDRLNELKVLEVEKGCSYTEAATGPMSADEIREFFADTTVYGVNEKGKNWALYYDPTGEARGKTTWSGGSDADSGTWKATSDDMLCLQWGRWRNGVLRCWQVYNQRGELTFVGKIGNAKSSLDENTRKQGNTENL